MVVLQIESLPAALFVDPVRKADPGPHVVIVDDFLPNPLEVRRAAIESQFLLFSPPDSQQVGDEVASANRDPDAKWLTTTLLRFKGVPVRHPQRSSYVVSPDVRERLGEAVGAQVLDDKSGTIGDGWHGAFHSINNEDWRARPSHGAIHHHYKEGDLPDRGWSGVVYLTPGAPLSAGTSLWKLSHTGRCVAPFGAHFSHNTSRYAPVLTIENRFNRLVLVRENVLHRVEHGFGSTIENGRLTQSFFFLVG
jgi:hypothetical protein